MTDAEVMQIAIIVALRHGGNFEHARLSLKNEGCILNVLGKKSFLLSLVSNSRINPNFVCHIKENYDVDAKPVKDAISMAFQAIEM
jgi:hypothetical protein